MSETAKRKVRSCYPDYDAMKNVNPKCKDHYWDGCGYGFCRKTGRGVKPETCPHAYEWWLYEEQEKPKEREQP